MLTFRDLLNEHAVTSWDKQESLFRVVGGEHDWRIDLGKGLLVLSNEKGTHDLLIQWLGSSDREAGRWLWSHANTRLDVPDEMKNAAEAIRAFGEERGIAEFTEPVQDLASVDADLIALVAVGLCEADGYYRCETEQGGEYFLFQSEQVRAQSETGPVRSMNVFLSILPNVDLDHKVAFIHFLSGREYEIEEVAELDTENSKLIARGPLGEIHATFDELGRITELSTKVASQSNGNSPNPQRPEVDA